MKQLFLVRHAKSSWGNPKLSDFDRPLNERGDKDKVVMGERLKNRLVKVDLIISSTAKRTTQTSIALAKGIEYPTNKIEFMDEIYHASPSAMLSVINRTDNEIKDLVLVGHNPGISMLCDYLCNYSVDFPTLGVAKISFETNDWQEVFGETGTLEWFDYPKNEN